MKQSLRNKITLHFIAVITAIIFVIVVVVSWQLHKSTSEQADLLLHDLTAHTFASVNGYHSIARSILSNIRADVRNYGISITQNSPVANNISRQQQESIVEFLQTSTVKNGIDFSLIFNVSGELQASSSRSSAYKPGDRDLPAYIDQYKTLSVGKKINAILKKEISFQISPQESTEQENDPALNGFIRLDPQFLRSIGIAEENINPQGAIALVAAGIIRDDFFIPTGIFIVGKILDNFAELFNTFHGATNVATSLYIGTTPIAYTGFDNLVLEKDNGSSLEIKPTDVSRIHAQKLPANITLSIASDRYLSTCSSITDGDQKKIGILCTGLPESQITEIQRPLLSHGAKTQTFIQQWLLMIGAVMIFIFILLARIIASGIIKPLEQVVEFTRKVGGGNFSQRLNNLSPNEVGILSRSIDAMLDKLNIAMKEKEILEAQLLQAHKIEAIGTLAGGIAHDFNNLLSVILGYTELAIYDAPAGSKFAKDLKNVQKAGGRAKELVQQILAFSRQTEVKRIPMQLQPLLKEVAKMLRSTLPASIEIHHEFDPKSGYILADPTQVHQILMNLCTNAYHAMEQTGGRLNIELKSICLEKSTQQQLALLLSPGEYLHLIVSDNGTGIRPEVLGKVFEPYFTTKEQGKGTGMGLAISHGIIASYGGIITVESELGKGTTFHIYFPVVDREETPIIKEADKLLRGTERILFVDDEGPLAEMGKDMLERLGYSVTVQQNSSEALSIFQNDPDAFNVIITDQSMPIMSGVDLARKMLQIRPDIPIILCTGYSNIIDEDSAKNLGIKAFALKPLSQEALARLVRQVLADS